MEMKVLTLLLLSLCNAPLPEGGAVTGTVYDLNTGEPHCKPVEVRIVSGGVTIAEGKSTKDGTYIVRFAKGRVVGGKGEKPSFSVEFGAKPVAAKVLGLLVQDVTVVNMTVP